MTAVKDNNWVQRHHEAIKDDPRNQTRVGDPGDECSCVKCKPEGDSCNPFKPCGCYQHGCMSNQCKKVLDKKEKK